MRGGLNWLIVIRSVEDSGFVIRGLFIKQAYAFEVRNTLKHIKCYSQPFKEFITSHNLIRFVV